MPRHAQHVVNKVVVKQTKISRRSRSIKETVQRKKPIIQIEVNR